ncbi:MAG: helix-turn-helix domain-containing protein, partial [Acidimicrobiia bacterium]|nr:helix-turn-helix domain-containing protein [Acidimicrobiia bacterium]
MPRKTVQYEVVVMPNEFPPILDTAMAAEMLSMNVDVVRRMARDGELPAYRLPGARAFRFFRDELMEHVRSFPVHEKVDSD